MRGRPTPPETRAAAVADYAAGMPMSKIIETHGGSPSSIANWARAAGVEIRPRHRTAASIEAAEEALTGGSWVRVGLVMRWQPFIAPSKRDLSDRERRVEWEDAMFDEDDAKALHARYFNGCREPRTVVGERVYQRRKKRKQTAKGRAA